MSEFVFRNLSVKLFPTAEADAADAGCICCSFQVACDDDCSLCTFGPTAPPECGACTDATDACGPCTAGVTDPPECGIDSCQDGSGCLHTVTIAIQGDQAAPRSPDVIAAELRALRAELLAAMGLPVEDEQHLRVADPERTPAEIDELRSALLSAVAELDEGRGSPPSG